jgi:hypothetical protein
VQKFAQYRGVITTWAKPLIAKSQIPMDRRLFEIGDLKALMV